MGISRNTVYVRAKKLGIEIGKELSDDEFERLKVGNVTRDNDILDNALQEYKTKLKVLEAVNAQLLQLSMSNDLKEAQDKNENIETYERTEKAKKHWWQF